MRPQTLRSRPLDPRGAPAGEPATSTAELIDAVFADAPTHGSPRLRDLGGRATRPVARTRFGAFAATTVGKIVLCTAVAAASVGGVYATTERIDLPEHIDPPSADATPAPAGEEDEVDGGAERPEVVERVAAPVQSTAPVPETNDAPSPADPETTDLEGCERGQATAAAASANGAEHPQGSGPPVDPCTRSNERGPDDASDVERRPDAADELPNNGPQSPPPAGGGNGGGGGGNGNGK